VCVLRGETGAKTIQRATRGQGGLPETKVLRPNMYGAGVHSGGCHEGCSAQEGAGICGRDVRNVRGKEEPVSTPQGWRSRQQCTRQPNDTVRFLSHEMALATWQEAVEEAVGLQSLRRACEEIGYVPETLSALPQIWRSITDEEKMWVGLRVSAGTPWCSEWPEVPRVITGQPSRVDRLRSLGNAVVPQVAEWIGRQIMMFYRIGEDE